MINDKGNFHRHAGIKVDVADTIGSGDSFLAGFLNKLLKGSSAEDALAFASTIGAFIATRSGACPEYNISQITELASSGAQKKSQTLL
jgi:fructokinase